MRVRVLLACAVLTAGIGLAVERTTAAQTNLQVTYGPQGVQQISYRGVPLEDVGQNPGDAFHIWHMKMTDLQGVVNTGGQYGWGETNNGKQWDAGTKTWTYPFTWGSIRVQFQQSGDTLNLNVTETNLASSGVILDGASIFPFVLHFPVLPAGFTNASYPQLSYNTTGPSALGADFGSGMVAAVVPSAAKPLYSGFMPTGQTNAYTPLIRTTTPDGLATFQPQLDRPGRVVAQLPAASGSAGAAGTDGQLYRFSALCTFGYDDRLALDGRGPGLGEDLAGDPELARSPDHRDGLSGKFADGRSDKTGRLP